MVAGAIAGLVLVNHRRERALRRSEARLDALLAQSHDVIVVLDDENEATFLSRRGRAPARLCPAGPVR